VETDVKEYPPWDLDAALAFIAIVKDRWGLAGVDVYRRDMTDYEHTNRPVETWWLMHINRSSRLQPVEDRSHWWSVLRALFDEWIEAWDSDGHRFLSAFVAGEAVTGDVTLAARQMRYVDRINKERTCATERTPCT
jgi:hypothetical protein